MATQSKNKKYGRNKKRCEVYQMQGRRERNKLRKMRRHMKHHPMDEENWNNFKRLRGSYA